jgi:hypothetical protein
MAEKRSVVKRVKNAVLYSDGTIRLDNCRASYPHLIEPYAGKDDDGKEQEPAFGIVFLMPKATHVAAKDLCKLRIEEVMRENKTPKLGADRKFLRDGDQSGKAENEGMFTVSAREKRPPVLRTPSKERIIRGKTETVRVAGREIPLKELFYGGCWVNGIIRPWWQSNGFGKRVNAGLSAVQFLRDGDAFGQVRVTEDDVDDSFEALEELDDSGFDDETEEAELIGGL